MSRLFWISVLAAASALGTPAAAQTVNITVPGGVRELPDPYLSRHYVFAPDNNSTSRDILWNEYWTPDRLGLSFDGATASITAERIAHPKVRHPSWNPELAATLVRNGESLSGHWLACQATHGSYDLVTDTYIGGNGIPQPCRE